MWQDFYFLKPDFLVSAANKDVFCEKCVFNYATEVDQMWTRLSEITSVCQNDSETSFPNIRCNVFRNNLQKCDNTF